MKYALVENDVCVNIIVLLPYAAARDFPNAYPIDDIPVQIGDTLDRGVWMRNGQKVLTYAEQNQESIEDVKSQYSDTDSRIRTLEALVDDILIEQLTSEGVLIS